MNIRNIKINNLILNIEWLFISLFSRIKHKKESINENEIKLQSEDIYQCDDELGLTTEEICCFLEEGKDFWKYISVNEKINEIFIMKEEQYQLSNIKKY